MRGGAIRVCMRQVFVDFTKLNDSWCMGYHNSVPLIPQRKNRIDFKARPCQNRNLMIELLHQDLYLKNQPMEEEIQWRNRKGNSVIKWLL